MGGNLRGLVTISVVSGVWRLLHSDTVYTFDLHGQARWSDVSESEGNSSPCVQSVGTHTWTAFRKINGHRASSAGSSLPARLNDRTNLLYLRFRRTRTTRIYVSSSEKAGHNENDSV